MKEEEKTLPRLRRTPRVRRSRKLRGTVTRNVMVPHLLESMRSLTQNEREQYSHILRFKESFPDFPEGILCFDDNPDVLIRTSEGFSGVEHTRLYRAVLKEQESLEHRIVDRAKEIYESSGGAPLYVTVLFNSNIRLRLKDIDSIAASLTGIVCSYIPNVGEHFVLEGWRFVSERCSPSIRTVFIDRPDNTCEMFWGVSRGGAVPNLASEQIRERIEDKEAKLGKYLSRCTKIWLLIVEDGFGPSSYFVISDEIKKQTYKSSFDRIFLFRNFSREVIELNVEP